MSAKYYRIGRVLSAPPDLSPEQIERARADARRYIENQLRNSERPLPIVRVPVRPPLDVPFSPGLVERSAINVVEFDVIEEAR